MYMKTAVKPRNPVLWKLLYDLDRMTFPQNKGPLGLEERTLPSLNSIDQLRKQKTNPSKQYKRSNLVISDKRITYQDTVWTWRIIPKD